MADDAAKTDTSDTTPVYRVLARIISRRILAGDFKPGEQLPPETVLAQEFGVHRSTVREGIRLLEETGMLRRKSQKRLMVAIPDSSHLAERSAQALVMRGARVKDLYEANLALDPAIARVAADRATEQQLARLAQNLEQTRGALGKSAELGVLDAEFHMLVCEAANNVTFPVIRQPLHDLFMPMVKQLIFAIDTSDRLIAAHAEIFDALSARDADRAEGWARRHIEDFKRGYLRAGLDFDAKVTLATD